MYYTGICNASPPPLPAYRVFILFEIREACPSHVGEEKYFFLLPPSSVVVAMKIKLMKYRLIGEKKQSLYVPCIHMQENSMRSNWRRVRIWGIYTILIGEGEEMERHLQEDKWHLQNIKVLGVFRRTNRQESCNNVCTGMSGLSVSWSIKFPGEGIWGRLYLCSPSWE